MIWHFMYELIRLHIGLMTCNAMKSCYLLLAYYQEFIPGQSACQTLEITAEQSSIDSIVSLHMLFYVQMWHTCSQTQEDRGKKSQQKHLCLKCLTQKHILI